MQVTASSPKVQEPHAGISEPAVDATGLTRSQGIARTGAGRLGRILTLSVVLIAMLAMAGCDASTPQSLFASRSTLAWTAQNLFTLIIWLAIVVFVVVEGGLLYVIWRFRARPGQGLPAQLHGNTRLEIAWTIAPAVVLAVIAVPTVTAIFDTARLPTSGDPLEIKVIGHQWWWEFRYPDDMQVVTANELHVPANRPIILSLESADVLHSFWIPRLGGKRDVVPNHINYINFVAEPPTNGTAETYLGQCVEFCGTSHANMRSRAIVHSAADFDAWVKSSQTAAAPLPAAFMAFAPVRHGQEFPGSAAVSSCIVCHTVDGTAAAGRIGPNLSHLGSRETIAAGLIPTTRENIAKWIRDPQAVKPGAKMPALNLTDADIDSIAEYLSNLK